MSDQTETLAAVLAEMRDLADHRAADAGGERPGIELLCSYADRIEAAAERERSPGNAAALRKALEGIEDDCRVLDRKDMWEEEGECYYDALRDIREKVNTALSAPARNCDRFATAEEAMREFDAMCEQTPYCRNDECIAGKYRRTSRGGVGCVPGWLFAPAEGGDLA